MAHTYEPPCDTTETIAIPCVAEQDLARADAIRENGGAGRDAVIDAYRTHAASIDPSTPAGEDRVRFLVTTGRIVQREFEPLLLRASDVAADDAVRFRSSIKIALI